MPGRCPGEKTPPFAHLKTLSSIPIPAESVLYATSAGIGGSGLDSVAYESLRGVYDAGLLGQALAYANRQTKIPRRKVRTLGGHPVRLLSFLKSPYYYGAKRRYVDWVASRELAAGGYEFFHGWSGDALLTLREARRQGVPSVLEIPTWHRNKGKVKPWMTRSEKLRDEAPFRERLVGSLLIDRQRVLEEYDLATLLLVLSEKAAETFRAVGVPQERLFKIARGVDVQRFTPAPAPACFRVVFVGALIRRKGVHLLLEAWHRLGFKNAELLLVGQVHEEIRPALEQWGGPTVKLAGFLPRPELAYREAAVHVLPSSCEGSAKTTYEAAACGLPQITTREAGDVVIDGQNGLIIPPENVEALATALERLYNDRSWCAALGAEGRRRVENEFTWGHFRTRLLAAYETAWRRVHG